MSLDLELGPTVLATESVAPTTVWVRTSSGVMETTMPRPSPGARGLLGAVVLAQDQAIPAGPAVDLAGLQVSWEADPARRYQVVLEIGAAQYDVLVVVLPSAGPGPLASKPGTLVASITDQAGTVKRSAASVQVSGAGGCFHLVELVAGVSGPTTRKARFQVTPGPVVVSGSAGYAARLAVYDVGAQA